jgi:hypothetical protein
MLSAGYLDGLERRELDDVRSMHEACLEVETELSYVRRMAQSRIAIVEAELEHRSAGGGRSLEDLIARLPQILADPEPRPTPASSRLLRHLAPSPSIRWTRGLEPLIADDTLVNLLTLDDGQLHDTVERLRELLDEVSGRRSALHAVIDRIESHLASRLTAEHQA